MDELSKSVNHKKVEKSSYLDPDELQLLDESDTEWSEAWKAAAKQLAELDVQVPEPVEQTRKLGTRKRR